MPYPNSAMNAQVNGGTAAQNVKMLNQPCVVVGTKITMSMGDEPGCAGGGVVSNRIKGECTYKMGSMKVLVEGKKLCHLSSITGMNGTPDNTIGAQVAPSAVTILVSG
jgi:Domain of unknown function (DUF4150)